MDVVHSCRCCLRRAPDKDLMTPYTHLGTKEIYLDMLKECFEIHLILDSDEEVGICDVCVGRLRDASDFKLQVQHSQVELQAQLQGALQVEAIKEETPAVESVMEDGDGTSEEPALCEEFKLEIENDNEISDEERQEMLEAEPAAGAGMVYHGASDGILYEVRAVKAEVSDDASSDEDCIPLAWAGAAGSGAEPRLERLRGDEAPHASQTCLAASRHGPRLASRMKDMPDDTAGLRAEEQAYTCDTCGEHFTDKSRLIDHVQAHVTQADKLCVTYSCKTCSKEFSCINLYRKHVDSHMNSEPYTCDMGYSCESSKTFVNNSVQIRHVGIHTGVKPYSCNECHKQFTIKYHLDRHKLIHTGVKLYSCNECEKRFTHKHNLGRHKLIHTEVKAYSCDECNKQFRTKGDLTRHERIHTGVKPYSCKECDKQFTLKHHLDTHKRVHTGVKPYSCDKCKKQFRYKCNLITHVKIHTRVKPYRSKECNKQFIPKHGLDKHSKDSH